MSLVQSGVGRSLTLTVGRLVIRNRSGLAGFITYDDLAEVLLVDTEASIRGDAAIGFSSILEALDDALAGTFATDGGAQPLNLTTEPKEAVVTRLLFDRLSIEQNAGSRRLVVNAHRARLGFDSGVLVLEDRVELLAPDGTRVRAPRAVLSRDHDAMFLPIGHVRDEVELQGSAFVALDREGNLSATPGMPPISYEDLIETKERLVLAHYVDRAPPALRPLLLAVLGQLGVPRSPRADPERVGRATW